MVQVLLLNVGVALSNYQGESIMTIQRYNPELEDVQGLSCAGVVKDDEGDFVTHVDHVEIVGKLRKELLDHQFQNDCSSGTDKCDCSEKNGYPCYRHLDHEYRKLFALNTDMVAEVEKKVELIELSKRIFRAECDRSHNLAEDLERLQVALDVSLNPTDLTAGLIVRAFWRRAHMYRNDYDKELPRGKVPTPLLCSMQTALLLLNMQGSEIDKRVDASSQNKVLLEAIEWALGANGDFPPQPEGKGKYWWRNELAERAGLKWSGVEYVSVQALKEVEG